MSIHLTGRYYLLLPLFSLLMCGRLASQPSEATQQGISLDSVFAVIGERSGMHVSYASSVRSGSDTRYDLAAGLSWKAALKEVLQSRALTFKTIGQNIIIYPQRHHQLSGYVYDQDTGESLPGCHVFLPSYSMGTTTNAYGYYQLAVPRGSALVQASYLGYQSQLLPLQLQADLQLDLRMTPSLDLPMVTISDSTGTSHQSFHLSSALGLDFGRMAHHLPSLGATADLARQLQFVPGVSSGGDGLGGLHVRGGGADQNLTLLDDIPIYNPLHMLGTSSIFNSDFVQRARLYKDAFAPKYSGRISSVLDVKMRDGHREAVKARAGVSLLSAHAVVEMPILGKRGTLMLAGERSHAGDLVRDFTRRRRQEADIEGFILPKYQDYYAKAMLDLGEHDKLMINLYAGGDIYVDAGQFVYEDQAGQLFRARFRDEFSWGNVAGGIKWLHTFGQRLFLHTRYYHSRFRYRSLGASQDVPEGGTMDIVEPSDITDFRSRTVENGVKMDLHWIAGYQHRFSAGLGMRKHDYLPGIIAYEERPDRLRRLIEPTVRLDRLPESSFDTFSLDSWQMEWYLEDDWQITSHLALRGGFYARQFFGDGASYFSLEPRATLSLLVGKGHLALSYASLTQPQHVITANDSGLPNELWVPAGARFGPQSSGSVALSWSSPFAKSWRMTSTLYHKQMNGLLTIRDDPSYLSLGALENVDALQWEDDVTSGWGRSYGWENVLHWQRKKTHLRLAYTFAKSNRTFEDKYEGLTMPYQFERPHGGNLMIYWPVGRSISIGVLWQVGSGLAFPLSAGSYDLLDNQDFFLEEIEVPEGVVDLLYLPTYHRLDVSVQYRLDRPRSAHQFKLAVLNAYDRQNLTQPKLSYFDDDTASIRFAQGFPIIPSVSYHLHLK